HRGFAFSFLANANGQLHIRRAASKLSQLLGVELAVLVGIEAIERFLVESQLGGRQLRFSLRSVTGDEPARQRRPRLAGRNHHYWRIGRFSRRRQRADLFYWNLRQSGVRHQFPGSDHFVVIGIDRGEAGRGGDELLFGELAVLVRIQKRENRVVE